MVSRKTVLAMMAVQHLIFLESCEIDRLRKRKRAQSLNFPVKFQNQPLDEAAQQDGRGKAQNPIRQSFELHKVLTNNADLLEFEQSALRVIVEGGNKP